jgi:hypothetical protein
MWLLQVQCGYQILASSRMQPVIKKAHILLVPQWPLASTISATCTLATHLRFAHNGRRATLTACLRFALNEKCVQRNAHLRYILIKDTHLFASQITRKVGDTRVACIRSSFGLLLFFVVILLSHHLLLL